MRASFDRSRRGRGRCNRESGFSLLELLVAGSLLGVLTVGLSTSASIATDLLRVQQARASETIVVNSLRARVLADALESTDVVCGGGDALIFSVNDGGPSPISVTEYRVDSGRLIRWRTPPDKEFVLADEAVSLACTDLGDEGAEVSVLLGDDATPSHFYFMVAEKPEVVP